MKKARSLMAVIALTGSLAACNTVAGIGEDITSASEAVQREISDDDNRQQRRNQSDDDNELLGGPDGQ